MSYVKVGVAGPVGSGKQRLLRLCQERWQRTTALELLQTIFIQKKMPSFLQRTVFFR